MPLLPKYAGPMKYYGKDNKSVTCRKRSCRNLFIRHRMFAPLMRGISASLSPAGRDSLAFSSWRSLAAANQLLHLNCHAIVLSRNPAAFALRAPHVASLSNVRWVRGSAVDFTVETVAWRNFRLFAKELKFDMVIHLTTESDNYKTLADPASAIKVIVGSTRQALKFAKEVGARRFLFTSSGSVYGLQPSEVTHVLESSAFAADSSDWKSAYAISGSAKLSAEKLSLNLERTLGWKLSSPAVSHFQVQDSR